MHTIIQFYNDIQVQHVSDSINVLIQPDALAQIDQAMELYYENRLHLDMNRESAKRDTG